MVTEKLPAFCGGVFVWLPGNGKAYARMQDGVFTKHRRELLSVENTHRYNLMRGCPFLGEFV